MRSIWQQRRSLVTLTLILAFVSTTVSPLAFAAPLNGAVELARKQFKAERLQNPMPRAPRAVDFVLTLLHSNDGESQLIDAGSGAEEFGGIARFKTLADILREEATTAAPSVRGAARGTLLVSSGDNLLPGPEFNASLDNGVPFFDSIALDEIEFDALTIGNHEFDFGPDVLADFLQGFTGDTTFISANLDFSAEPALQTFVNSGRLASSVVVTERGRRIGIVGATTENLPFISSPRDVLVNEVLPAVESEIDALKARGVNIIILSTHLQGIESEIELVSNLRDVDIVIAGGGDNLLANAGDLLIPGDVAEGPYPAIAIDADGVEVPVVATRGDYRYIGRLVAGFDRNGRLRMVGDESGPVRVAGGNNPDGVAADPLLQALVVDPVAASVQALASNVIAVSDVALEGSRPQIRQVETNLGNLCADSMLWQASQLASSFGVPVPDVAIQNGGGIRNNSLLPAGDFTELDTFDILPFSNFVSVLPNIPREQFKEIMENAVSLHEFVSGRWAHLAGATMTWDPNGTAQVLDSNGNVTTAGSRVVELTLDDGTPIVANGSVVPGSDLTLATIDFLARGGDQYPYRGAPFVNIGVSYQQALENYVRDALNGQITAADYPESGEGRIVQN